MKTRSDVMNVLSWGLRKYAWVVALPVLALGLLVPTAMGRATPQYEASAQVGPARVLKLPNLDALPRFGDSVFDNVLTAPEVRRAAGLSPGEPLGPDHVELVVSQDNIIFTVLGRSANPESAKVIADTAAARFTDELNKYTPAVGSFAIQRLATTPVQPVPTIGGGLKARALGIASGLVAGAGLVSLLVLWRRPVIDVQTAEDVTEARVLGRAVLSASRGPQGITLLCRRLLSTPTRLLLLVGPSNTRRDRLRLSRVLTDWLSSVRDVRTITDGPTLSDFGAASYLRDPEVDGGELLIATDASPVEVATRPGMSMTLLVVREGISQRSLREYAEQYLDDNDAAVLLVRRPKWRLRRRHRTSGAARGTDQRWRGEGQSVGLPPVYGFASPPDDR